MSIKQIKELQRLGVETIPESMYPAGWLEWANNPEKRVNLNRARVCVDAGGRANAWGHHCLFIVNGLEYRDRGYSYRNDFQRHRVNGRPVRVYIGTEALEEAEGSAVK